MVPENPPSPDSPEFERVWRVFVEIGVAERHFNQVESTYRALASTWLLASFAGVGYLLGQDSFGETSTRILMAAGVPILGVVGVTMLWVVDLHVYHRLLDAWFAQGLRLEDENPWLVPVRHQMLQSMRGQGVLPKIVWFYGISNGVLLTVSGILVSIWATRFGNLPFLGCLLLTGAAVASMAWFLKRFTPSFS